MSTDRSTTSGIEVEVVYRPAADPIEIEDPGEFPFTRGPHSTMYRRRPWTMRQYAGFGTADETNRRFRALLAAGQHGLSVAFDLPTQMGYDSDHPMAAGEVGKVGVAIDTLDDMRRLLAEIPLGEVSTSMTINATAPILLLLYEAVAEEQGIAPDAIRGTVQNDILKEYVARGTYIYPPRESMRLVTDLFAYCATRLPSWNTISISGYHIREAGATAVQEVAFTLSHGLAYVRAAIDAGLGVDDFAPRLSFFWNSHNNLFEEVAKFRAARRLWAKLMTERIGASTRVGQDAVPYPDGGEHPHRPAAREQHRPHDGPGAGGDAGGNAVPSHKRFRRGAGTAHRAFGDDRPENPADPRCRVGSDRHR